MKLTRMAALALAGAVAAGPALAELVFPSLSYRTGPYAAGGIPFADGYEDYFTLLNERDGGIGGVMISVPECETGYNTEKGVECYEATKDLGALVYQPLSTGITYQLIPKVTADGIPLHTLGYGRTSAMNGAVFSNVFNYPANYWDGASIAINYIMEQSGGDISGQKIALVYHDSAYGREPIRTLEELATTHGFTFLPIAVEPPGQEQTSQWLQIRRERPDWVLMWGWGVQNQVAIQEAANINYPMDHFIGAWWSGAEHDVIPAGAGADNYLALNMHGIGRDYPIYDDIQTYVVDRGVAAGAGDQIGSVLYSRGIYAAMLVSEAARTAQEIHGTADITPAMMRDGMEALVITEERMAELGLPGFGPAFEVSCQNHGGPGTGFVQQWDADSQSWSLVSELIQSDRELIGRLVAEDSAAYAAENGIEPGCQ